jgi:1,4-alpha-glucan branching enzyme
MSDPTTTPPSYEAPVDADTPQTVSVRFTLSSDVHAKSASVVGAFNDWNPNVDAMSRATPDAALSCSIDIPGGRRYQYRFLLDGDRWTNDPHAHDYVPNEYGGHDSVLDLTARPDRSDAEAGNADVATHMESLRNEREVADDVHVRHPPHRTGEQQGATNRATESPA